MDLNLNGNNLKIQFQNSPVLEGISVHETIDKVYILVSTVASVHRLVFPHPRKLGSVAAVSIGLDFYLRYDCNQTEEKVFKTFYKLFNSMLKTIKLFYDLMSK
jgi:hypothetical protein